MRIAKSLKVIAGLAALMLVSMQSYAQNSQSEASILPPRYEVELIIFRHLDQSRNTPEIPAAVSMIQDSPFELQLAETGPGQDARSASDTLPEGRARATAADDGNAKPANSERTPTVGKEIADDFNSSMDRAKNVENQVMQQKQDIDKALKEAEGET